MKNKIYSFSEYVAQGFSAEEVPFITRHDVLFNKSIDGLATDEEIDEMYQIQKMLGL